jgi:peptide chain release factor 1
MQNLDKILKDYKSLIQKMEEALKKKDFEKYNNLAKELAKIESLVNKVQEYKKITSQIQELNSLIIQEEDKNLISLIQQELKELKAKEESIYNSILLELTKEKEESLKEEDVIVELRAGTGGEESCLFVADLYRMYNKYIQNQGWRIEVMTSNPTGIGGFKEIIFSVSGKGAYKKLRHESGVHRVQRVPETEASGRIHTSAATVAVLKEPKEIEVNINPNDIRIDTFRASGHGGQHVNVTDSAVRITHLPTNIVVTCQDERSQYRNKEKAMRILKARVKAYYESKEEEKIAKERREQVKSGDRSEKIRTYNFPQNRVTDHRINLSLYNLREIMDGELDELIEALNERLG